VITNVTRTVERLDGLALLGAARVGPIGSPTPALLEPAGPGTLLTLESLSSGAGVRHLVISDGPGRLELSMPILAPEVMGPPAAELPVGPGAVLVHAPLARPEEGARAAPDLVALGNARALWSEGMPFVRAIREVRERFGGAPVLWAPRVALPHRVPFLLYLGVDWVDTTEGLLEASQGQFLDPTLGRVDRDDVRSERACGCPSCEAEPAGPLEAHTIHAFRRAVAEARAAARLGRLRELVEARLPAEPALAELLRYADRELEALLDERTPVVGHGSSNYVLAEAHRRPEMARFRRRLLERYRPPPSKTVLLLVPCSKTKPYRHSRSHRRFASAFEDLRAVERVHLVSVSSPIGLVPRELEDVPPARHYDIPVTGEWTEPERAAVTSGLRYLLANGAYRSVVVHLDPQEYAFLRPELPSALPVGWTLGDDRTTSAAALESLRGAIRAALETETPVPGGPLAVVREELRAVAGIQFGRGPTDRLFAAPVRLAGRPWFQRLTDGRTDLATVREERGLFQLTVAGARRLVPDAPLAVEIDPALTLAGDLFTPGVRSADRAIRVGDSVVLLRDGRLAGVGEAALPGALMTELGHGLAVRVRHREHATTDTPKTEDTPRSASGPVVQR
jgi:archaeosine synthase alpha-subunit